MHLKVFVGHIFINAKILHFKIFKYKNKLEKKRIVQ